MGAEKKKAVKIYVLRCPDTGEVRYVGKTVCDLEKRFSGHLNDNRKTHRKSWIDGLRAKGKIPTIEPIEEFVDGERDWQDRERYWILFFRQKGARLLNHTDGGEGLHNPDDVTRKKLGDNSRGRVKSEATKKAHREKMLNFRHTEETKRKISEQKKGLKLNLSDSQRQALRDRQTGKRHTEEAKRKISIAGKGRKKSPEEIEKLKNPLIVRVTPESTKKMTETKRMQASDPQWRERQSRSLGAYAQRKASDDQVKLVRDLRNRGMSYGKAGESAGVTQGIARRICLRIGPYVD
jgi:hypothetical protein